MPSSTASVERLFSLMNNLCTTNRNRLSQDTLTALMMLCREGCQQLSDDQTSKIWRVELIKVQLHVEARRGRHDDRNGHDELAMTIPREAFYSRSPGVSDIIGTNLLTKFHEHRKINVASRVLTRKNAPQPGSHVFQPTGIIF
ncbi:hypothetical protein DPMN_024207 [Dreissena polymorpha]|uniref:HAT C-terminal dimerisation domain-containing protein n=2 Tax=Dreissena polymorpha TaxID=45954 RepID=A0A9D4LNG7_DREPO|nr:hypothetical protein DPMN_024207 [Dreissena polymorpha]